MGGVSGVFNNADGFLDMVCGANVCRAVPLHDVEMLLGFLEMELVLRLHMRFSVM